ncbi:MAG TPA: PH domain-containing protein [Candidatus Saccharimonadia bacterium]|nr:PH domain-containing protein [Candidatus Saccharimonadia bacterium]
MVSKEYIEKQLKDIDFKITGWGKAEVNQLPHIILPDEKIYEAVNGIYEGGFALLLATDIRVLLVDKKLMSFLTVEDLRFDMINEIDYNHRLVGAYITIATGNKTLVFRSYNKDRLRKLIGHVQHCMAETKKKQSSTVEDQSQHLERINEQLQAYLVAQYKQQQKLHEELAKAQTGALSKVPTMPEPLRPPDELSNFLYARGLLDKYREATGRDLAVPQIPAANPPASDATDAVQAASPPQAHPWEESAATQPAGMPGNNQLTEIYSEGMQEVFGKRPPSNPGGQGSGGFGGDQTTGLEVNPIKIAISKLPLALRNRKFGLPKPSLPVYRAPAPPKPQPRPAG